MAEKKSLKPSEHNLTQRPDYVSAIGMVALETVDLEIRLAGLFAAIVGLSSRVAQAIYFSPKAEQARMDILRNAANAAYHVSPSRTGNQAKQKRDALLKVETLLKRSEKVIRKRHRVVHDDWNISEKEKTVTRRPVGGELERPRTPVPISDLSDIIKQLRELIDDVYDLSKEFKERPPHMVSLRSEPRE
ncbi:MAG TPA: hypothetical protein VK438_06985 [Xanthobacteraceae bacterium]|nr:hypothetical protein [Xanthobacteraceae bacterium]